MIMTVMRDKKQYDKRICHRHTPREKYYITNSWNKRLMLMD